MSTIRQLVLFSMSMAAATHAAAQCTPQWSSSSDAIADMTPWWDGGVIVVGNFTSIGGVAANHVARSSGATWLPLGAGLDAPATHATMTFSGDLLVAGSFVNAGGVPSPGLALWDGVAWHAHPGAPLGPILAMVTQPIDTIWIARSVSPSPTIGYIEIARFDGISWQVIGTSSGSTGTQPFPTFADLVTLPNGTLIAAGSWAAMNPMGAPGPTGYRELVAWNWSTLSWDWFYDAPHPEDLLVSRQGDLYLACSSSLGGGIHHRSGGSWNGPASTSLGEVYALAELPNGDIVAAGQQTGQPWQMGCRRWNGTAWTDLGFWTPGAQGSIDFLFAHEGGGRLFASGAFTSAGGIPASNRAWLTTPCPPSLLSTPTTCVGSAGPLTTGGGTLPWVGGTATTWTNGFAPNAVAVTVFGLNATTLPLAGLLPTSSAGCDLLVTPDVLRLDFPMPGMPLYLTIPIPDVPALAGSAVFQQTGQLGITAGTIVSASIGNRLAMIIGML